MFSKNSSDTTDRPSAFNVSEWSLRRKVALVLTVPVLVAGAFGGLRVRTEMSDADNYAATSQQVSVLGPAVAYLDAAENAALEARTVGIQDPKLAAAQQEVVRTGAALVEARDQANLTPAQLTQVNSVLSLSEQMRNGMAYVSLSSSVTQVRQLERGVAQIITSIVDEQKVPEPRLQVLAQTLDGRLSLTLQLMQVANVSTIPANPVELYSEFGVELGAIDRLAVALGQTDPQVLKIRQSNAQRVVNARGGNTKIDMSGSYAAYNDLTDTLLTGIDKTLAQRAADAQVNALLDSAIILGALLAAMTLALMVARLLINPIRRVRAGALKVANEKLPEAVARIRAGEQPEEIVPIGVTTHEELGQLARAVDDMHRQAVKLASGEAQLRAQVGDMFVTLSRRNTSLINQQLGLIETLESDEEDPQRLESLFRLDHLAARMRRNAESLVILSGAPTRATEQDELSLGDVMQAAIAGVQDYRRVQLDPAPAQRVGGAIAADIVHLLAELVDNALSYSPPSASVLVTSSFTRGGVIVQVTDAGLGIADDTLIDVNANLRSGGEVTPDTARRMGLFVVSRLAQRHGLQVSLDQNDRQGITATVYIPAIALSDTARIEAGPSTDAEAIELGPVTTFLSEPDESKTVPRVVVSDESVDHEFDRITNAINAYGLPQRRPGASGAGVEPAMTPMGGLFERPDTPAIDEAGDLTSVPRVHVMGPVQRDDETDDSEDSEQSDAAILDDDPVALELVADPVEETDAEGAEESDESDQSDADDEIVAEADDETDESDETDADSDSDEDDQAVAEHEDADEDDDAESDADDAHEDEAADEVEEADDQDDDAEHVGEDEPAAAEHEEPADGADEDEHDRTDRVVALVVNGHSQESSRLGASTHEVGQQVARAAGGASFASLAVAPTLHPVLDRSTAAPASDDDELTPIFRSLQSNWLSSTGTDAPWSSTEADAGWDAADRVEATPPTRRTETGLPMRRPGNRLIPGGLAPIQAPTVRDPEAIRARLAAHAAGVSRGRTAAVHSEPTTEEAGQA